MINSTHKAVMLDYLDAWSNGDLEGVLSFFSANARIHSPIQDGPKKPQDFYPPVMERSRGSKFKAKAIFAGEQPHLASVFIDYSKLLPDGSLKVFDCVDVFSFDANGKINDLWIVFDSKNLNPN
jgi:hypothetical protein